MEANKTYTLSDIKDISVKLDIANLIQLNDCIETGVSSLGEKIDITVITTHSQIAKILLQEQFGINFNEVFRLSDCELNILYGNERQFKLFTIEGAGILVDENTFVDALSKSKINKQGLTQGNYFTKDQLLSKINIRLILTHNLASLHKTDWIIKLAGSDYVFFMLDSLRAFDTHEKNFFENNLAKLFSRDRMSLILGNLDYLKAADQIEIYDYVNLIADKKYDIVCSQNTECAKSEIERFNSKLLSLSANTMQLRETTKKDAVNYSILELKEELPAYKESLNGNVCNVDKSINLLSRNNELVNQSMSKINRKIDSYFKDYSMTLFVRKIDEFNNIFKKSIESDISESNNINEDSKFLNKYMDHVWNKFMDDQSLWLRESVLEEANQIETMIKNDLLEIVGQMDVYSQELVQGYLSQKYDSHSFLIEKSKNSGVGELSKCLNIGAVILLIFSPVAAILTFGGSQLIKRIFKDSIQSDRKEQLAISVATMSDNLKEQVIKQIDGQYDTIVAKMKEQSQKVFSDVLLELTEMLSKQRDKLNNVNNTLKFVEELEQGL